MLSSKSALALRHGTLALGLLFALGIACSGKNSTRSSAEPDSGGMVADAGGVDDVIVEDAGLMIDAAYDGSLPPRRQPVHAVHRIGNLPDGVESLFETGTVTAGSAFAPELVYPTPKTMFPPNLERLLFQFRGEPSHVFQIHFETTDSTLNIYTDGLLATCSSKGDDAKCWQAEAATLKDFATAVAGMTATVTLRSLDPAAPDVIHESSPFELYFGPTPVDGAIYYWSTTEQGIRRTTLNSEQPFNYVVPETYATDEKPQGPCVACHTLSRSGELMAMSFPGDLLGVIEVSESLPPPLLVAPGEVLPGRENYSASWITFSPDDSQVATAGVNGLSVREARTGSLVAEVPLEAGTYASMPDWSPDGTRLAFALHENPDVAKRTRHLEGSSIGWMTKSGDSFAGLELLAEPSTATETYAYPMFSPDGKWLALVRSDSSSEEDPSAEILVAPAQSDPELYPLTRANTHVGARVAPGELMNNMPTWAPTGSSRVAWIAFTTRREYGFIQTGESVTKQLWVAAIDTTKIGSEDSSFPAFRLPGQDLSENNHRPFWAVDVLPPDWKPPIIR